jgi:hypothetical protein
LVLVIHVAEWAKPDPSAKMCLNNRWDTVGEPISTL